MPTIRLPFLTLLLIMGLLAGTAVTGCRRDAQAGAAGHNHPMAELHTLPETVQAAPVSVQEAYQFAVANPDILDHIPCYCGCGPMGHTSNYSCYVAGNDETGAPIHDPHALGCGICVDITHDTMRLLDAGQDVDQILSYVNQTYSRFGPPTPGN